MLTVGATEHNWLELVSEAVRHEGCGVVTGVLSPEQIARTRAAMYEVQARIHEEVGAERLAQAGERGVLRLMARYDPLFLELLELPEMLAVVDEMVSDTAILHLQNGFVLPPEGRSSDGGAPGASMSGAGAPGAGASAASTFQGTFHRDFPRHLHGYMASINALLTLDPFTAENGATLVAPGTQQRPERPAQDYLEAAAVAVECPAGAMIVFDSTLWHAAGANLSDRDRVAINHQFTRSFLKQQIDYVRALGDEVVRAQSPRVQQLLGWYTRVVTSLAEYYRPAHERLYRAGQG